MPKNTQPTAPPRQTVKVTYMDGKTDEYDTSTPMLLYQVNRLGVRDDDIDASFFLFWLAAGAPGLNGQALMIDVARPAMETWLASVKAVEQSETDQSGPPTTQPATSRGSAA